MHDLRHALRGLVRAPAFAAIAVLTLALGVGANTAIFAVVDAILLRPLPYERSDGLVRVLNRWEGSPRAGLSPAEYFDYAEQARGLAAIGAQAGGSVVVTGGDRPERVVATFATASLLDVLGTPARLGRAYTAAEDAPGAPDVVLLTDGFWRRRFGGDPSVVGGAITIDGRVHTVLGVMPPSFRMPLELAGEEDTEIILPLALDRSAVQNRGSHFLDSYARIAPATDRSAAQASIADVAARFVRTHPDDYPAEMNFGVSLVPLQADIVGPVRTPLFILLGAVGFVLLMACANVASLLLSRADARRREFAVRAALGAGRGRLLRQLVVESVVLAAAGATAGVLLAVWGATALVSLTPPDIPRLESVGLGARVLGFALFATMLTALLFGLPPALDSSRPDLYRSLREGGRGGSPGKGANRFRRALVVGELALAVVLLAGAGLLGRSLLALHAVDPGFRTADVLTFRVSLPAASYPEEERVTAFFGQLVDRIAALPGVESAGAVTNLPLLSSLGDLNMQIEGRIVPEGATSPRADWQTVTPGYFDAIGMRVLRGRAIERRDDAPAPGVVVINRSLADLYWPGEDPIDRRFTLGGGAGPGTVTVVGIVDDVRHASLAIPPRPEMYLAHAQFRFWNGGSVVRALTLAIHAAGDAAALAPAVREAVRRLDPDLPVSALQTMAEVRGESIARPRFLAVLLVIFSAVALLLAAVGVYGVMSFTVAQRTHEMGIRVALGARPAEVFRMVVAQGMALALGGIALGLAGALALTRTLRALLYDVAPRDPLTLGLVSAALALVALVACWVPARRATGADPLRALRQD
jgi:putative ABC transport system permease protein